MIVLHASEWSKPLCRCGLWVRLTPYIPTITVSLTPILRNSIIYLGLQNLLSFGKPALSTTELDGHALICRKE